MYTPGICETQYRDASRGEHPPSPPTLSDSSSMGLLMPQRCPRSARDRRFQCRQPSPAESSEDHDDGGGGVRPAWDVRRILRGVNVISDARLSIANLPFSSDRS